MPNVLEGIEFRELKAQLPSWRVDENFTEWQDTDGRVEFPTGTEFRIKEEVEYVVTFNSRKDTSTTDKTKAMARVAKLLEDDFEVTVNKFTRTQPSIGQYLVDKGVQFKLTGSEKWMAATHFGGSNQGARIKFRIRPDNYFSVQVKNGIALSELNFDDVDELETYLTRQLRTSENNIVITRRNYGVSLHL